MLLPYTVDVPMERIPITNWVIMGLTTLIGIVLLADLYNHDDFDLEPPAVISLAVQPSDFSPIQLITYQFAHGGILHLIGNMIFLFVFGNAVNAKLGHVTFLLSYLFLGVIGGLGWVIFGKDMPMIGASGSIMGMLGMFFILFPKNHVEVLYMFLGGRSSGSFPIAAFWVILFYLGGDLFAVLWRGNGAIAYVTHLTAGVAGMFLAMTLLAVDWVKSTDYEENLLQVMGIQPKAKRRVRKDKPWFDMIEEEKRKKKKKKPRRSEEFEAD